VFERYSMPVGMELLDRIWADWGVRRDVRVDFFVDGKEMVACHSCNVRHQTQVVFKYAKGIRDVGHFQDVRGKGYGLEPEDDTGPYRMLSYGSLSRGIYLAGRLWPTAPNVVATLEKGIVIDVLSRHTPADVCSFMRDWFNQWHGTAGEMHTS
jgi:hypothetical protein